MGGLRMRILILGGYGFIGAEILRACAAAGFDCAGLGRNAETGKRLVPEARWIGADMSALDSAEKWAPHLEEVDAIVNAAGALQDGARDDLEAIHHRSIAALVDAAVKTNVRTFIQISAPGAAPTASTAFMRTKAAGDAAVKASSIDWIILRPGLVIGRGAYGGTAMLRMLAGFPLMTPLVAASSLVQTVSIDDVAAAVVKALSGEIPMRRDFDLVEDTPHTLREIVRGLRRRLGFRPVRLEPDLPDWAASVFAAMADLAGSFGWRSPLRSTAMKVIREGVLADPGPWRAATGRSLMSLDETLSQIPGTAQERLYARAQLALPVMIVTLGLFWIASGLVGWAQMDRASALLPAFDPLAAGAMVAAGAVVDVLLGALILFRRTSRSGAAASVIVALFYLLMGSLLAPHLWADPLGPLVKIFPALALGIAVALMLEER